MDFRPMHAPSTGISCVPHFMVFMAQRMLIAIFVSPVRGKSNGGSGRLTAIIVNVHLIYPRDKIPLL